MLNVLVLLISDPSHPHPFSLFQSRIWNLCSAIWKQCRSPVQRDERALRSRRLGALELVGDALDGLAVLRILGLGEVGAVDGAARSIALLL
eukprot:8220392-Pyramimonas_sp.AAC.1